MLDKLVKLLFRNFINALYTVHISGTSNIPKDGSAILVSNHQSYLDAPAMLGFFPRDIKFLAYYKLFEIFFVGRILKVHHDVPIKDKDREQIKDAFNQCCDILNKQEILCIFPEGNLTPDGTIHEFKHGIKYLWMQCPKPIIPVAIHGFYNTAFGRKSFRQKIFQNPLKKKDLWIIIGEPIDFKEIPDPDLLRDEVLKLKNTIQNN